MLPGSARSGLVINYRVVNSSPTQKICRRESGLTAADDDDVG